MIDKLLGDILTAFYEDCRAKAFQKEILMWQGNWPGLDFAVIQHLKNANNQDEIIERITVLAEEKEFQEFVLSQVRRSKNEDISRWERKQLASTNEEEYRYYDILISSTNKYLSVLDWKWYVENNCQTFLEVCKDAKDWRWILMEYLYWYYNHEKYGRFLNYYKDCPLDLYLRKYSIKGGFESNYGLLSIQDDWVLKSGRPSKVFIPQLNTHIIIRHTPSDMLALIEGWRHETKFDLSLRPDYNVCGEKILDLQYICEEKDFGRSYCGQLSSIDRLSKYYDRDWDNDWLIVQHTGEKGDEITFEEIMEGGPHDQDNYVTQVVHLQFIVEGGKEFIKHIDHEYAFYNEAGIEEKRNKLQTKGEARKRYKTFKIDNARIPFVNEAGSNIVYKVLTSYFTKVDLVDEFFNY